MYIRQLDLHDFRSWDDVQVTLTPGITVFVGRNGFGKTNLVEAVGYLSTLSSHRVASDAPLVRSGTDRAVVGAHVVNAGRELALEVEINAGKANRARINGSPTRRPREIVGIARTVLFAPEDLSLVRGDPGDRRRYLDELVTVRTPRLAGERSDYERVLRQRSALLKTAGAARRRGDGDSVAATLDVWDGHLVEHGSAIVAARLALVHALSAPVAQAYADIAPESRPVRIAYRSSLADRLPPALLDPARPPAPEDLATIRTAFLEQLEALRHKEIERGVCLVGPHRDDLDLVLGTDPAKGYASHGESWSFALALRLGAFALLRDDGADPILLLDDVFAELDRRRRDALADVAATAEQVLVTAAVAEDVPDMLAARSIRVEIENGADPSDRRSRIVADTDGAGPAGSEPVRDRVAGERMSS